MAGRINLLLNSKHLHSSSNYVKFFFVDRRIKKMRSSALICTRGMGISFTYFPFEARAFFDFFHHI